MAKKSDKYDKSGLAKESASKKWESLTWQDLEAWAGGRSVSRGQAYQRQGRVRDLARSADDRLLAMVMGGEHYVTCVWLHDKTQDEGPLQSKCTCPVGYDGCKHAVAVVAEYLERLGREESVGVADADDLRWDKLEGDNIDGDFDDEEGVEAFDEDAPVARRKAGRRTRDDWNEKINQHIQAKSREELAELVCSLTERFPELREEFRERIALGEGDVDRLVTQARAELQRVTSQEAWRNHWDGQGNIPDYSKLRNRLHRIAELGHPDTVAKMAEEILSCGLEQVGRARDEGETAMEFAQCLPIVFNAVMKSSLAPAEKVLLAIDAHLKDDYDTVGDTTDVVLTASFKAAEWSIVADELAHRLGKPKSAARRNDDDDDDDDGFSRDYQRDQISGWLVDALNKAGRGEEVPAIYEKEARATGSYERLVKFLIDRHRFEDARRWATEGIEKTAKKLPGIAANLAESLCDLASRLKQWDIVAAHAAYGFFDRPGQDAFNQLIVTAEKAGCGEPVRRLAHVFLETGTAPIFTTAAKKGGGRIQTAAGWPLPVPDYLIPLLLTDHQMRRSPEPHWDVLIDMAIADKRPDVVLHWYDKICAERKKPAYGESWNGPGAHADRVAEAVAKSHPLRSLDIYQQRVSQNLTQASVSAYETVAGYLRKIKPIMKSVQRDDEWKKLIEDIRLRYRNRPKFMEILDRLEDRPILAKRKSRK